MNYMMYKHSPINQLLNLTADEHNYLTPAPMCVRTRCEARGLNPSFIKAEFMYSREKWYELTSTRLGRDLRFCFGVFTVFNVFN